jgi:hypothetical protein
MVGAANPRGISRLTLLCGFIHCPLGSREAPVRTEPLPTFSTLTLALIGVVA